MCLVFLETQCDDLAARLDRAHMVDVLRKSVGKMSPMGVAMVSEVPLSPTAGRLVAEAVAPAASA
jgi:hypothetical protein